MEMFLMLSPSWSSGKSWPGWRSLNTCEGQAELICQISLTYGIEIKPLNWLLGMAEAECWICVARPCSKLAPYQTHLYTWFMGNLQIIYEAAMKLPQR